MHQFGRISGLLNVYTQPEEQRLVLVEVFALSGALHTDLRMPLLAREMDGAFPQLLLIRAHVSVILTVLPRCSPEQQDIRFVFNAQHDCYMLRCSATATKPVRQERVVTARTVMCLAHGDDDHFVVNIHALHNAHLLRKALPRQLVQPTPLYQDRYQHHATQAHQLRLLQTGKRDEKNRKSQATREANKKRKLNAVALAETGANEARGVHERC
jgi:hypothetical protein